MSEKFGSVGSVSALKRRKSYKLLKKIQAKGYNLKKINLDKLNELKPGTQLMIPMWYWGGIYSHWGIYNGDSKVIDYSGNPIVISIDKLSSFSYGEPSAIWVGLAPRNVNHAAKIIERAKSRIGESNYNFFSNNCEHFANWAYHGKDYSDQVEHWLSYLFKLRL